MRTRTAILALAVVVAATRPASAQVERYELGQRLKRFEIDWEKADEAGRKRALKVLQPLTRQYLTFQFAEAGRTLDEARFALRTEKPTDAERWFDSLAVIPEKRLFDAKTPELKVEIRAFYTIPGGLPNGLTASLQMSLGEIVEVPLAKLPSVVTVPSFVAKGWNGDHLLWFMAKKLDKPFAARTMPIATLIDLQSCKNEWARISNIVIPNEVEARNRIDINFATVQNWSATLLGLANGDVFETDTPVRHWANEMAIFAIGGSFGGPAICAAVNACQPSDARNQYWLTVPTSADKRIPCRIFFPPRFEKPVPIVVALHGMGGSENLFFEGYGAGCVVKACEKRGWMLVCPRGGNGFLGGPPPVTEIIDKLAERYPIDKSRVFLMGHSMGAAQTVDLAQQKPGAFAAIAALGGGGRVRKPEAFNGVPTFIGVGSEDFAKGGAEALHKALADAGVKTATLKEYPDVEHTVIVRVAVDDVFAEFDRASSSSPQRGGR